MLLYDIIFLLIFTETHNLNVKEIHANTVCKVTHHIELNPDGIKHIDQSLKHLNIK